MSKDFDYLVDDSMNDDHLMGHDKDFLGPSNNDSNNGHGEGTLGLNPNGHFAYVGDDVADDNEFHVWCNIANWELLSNINDQQQQYPMC